MQSNGLNNYPTPKPSAHPTPNGTTYQVERESTAPVKSYERTPEEVRRIESMVEAVFGEQSPLQRSVLTPQQALVIARMWAWADHLDRKYPDTQCSMVVRDLAQYLVLSRVSIKGRGRDDLRTALEAVLGGGQLADKNRWETIRERILG